MNPVQNANVWRGARGLLDIPPGPSDTPLMDVATVSPVYDIGQSGWALLNYFAGYANFASLASPQAFALASSAFLASNGEQPDVTKNRRLNCVVATLAGGVTTPLLMRVGVRNAAAQLFVLHSEYVPNPGVYNFPFPGAILQPGLDFYWDVAAGAAGDSCLLHLGLFWQEPGAEIPR